MKVSTFIMSLFIFTMPSLITLQAQPALEQSVKLEYDSNLAPGYHSLRWEAYPGANAYTVVRRAPGASSWGFPAIATLPGDAQSWTDSSARADQLYEYKVTRTSDSGAPGEGYITVVTEMPVADDLGRVLVLVERELARAVSGELKNYVGDLLREGYRVSVDTVDIADEPSDVRDGIRTWYNADAEASRAVVLIGHVPVPYSGNIAPDGHPDHQGAWPADGYYGEMDGLWSDWQVNNTNASQMRNWNQSGDGKFDNVIFPSPIDLWVGRIDFSALPAFAEDEVQLTKIYLEKLHRFKEATFRADRRAVVEDNFSGFAEGFSQSGWKSFVPILGIENVYSADYRNALQSESHLFSYGCGPGSYTSAGGISNTSNMAADSLQGVFTMLFGSYFGDWDVPNSFLRAALASGTILTNVWAGRPHWMLHPMALGATIGECARLSMDNSSTYKAGFGGKGVHMALMGDPTLQWHYVRPVTGLTATEEGHKLRLSWKPSDEATAGYRIYRRIEGEQEFVAVSETAADELTYYDSCLLASKRYEYRVHAVDLVQSASGSYYRMSLADTVSHIVEYDGTLATDFSWDDDFERVEFTFTGRGADSLRWDFGDGMGSAARNPQHEYTVTDSVFSRRVCLFTTNVCHADTQCYELQLLGQLPRFEVLGLEGPRCWYSDSVRLRLLLQYGGAEPLDFSGHFTRTADTIELELANDTGVFIVKNRFGRDVRFGPFSEEKALELEAYFDIRNPGAGLNDGRIVVTAVGGGTAPYSFVWSDGSTGTSLEGLAPGAYWLDITDSLFCVKRYEFTISNSTGVLPGLDAEVALFPNPFDNHLVYVDPQKLPARLRLIGADGRVYGSWKSAGTARFVLDFDSGMPDGMYFLQIEREGQLQHVKLVKTAGM